MEVYQAHALQNLCLRFCARNIEVFFLLNEIMFYTYILLSFNNINLIFYGKNRELFS